MGVRKKDYGIALTPFTSSDATSPWHVAFPGRNFAARTPIAGTLHYRPTVTTTTKQPTNAAPPTTSTPRAPLGTVSPGATNSVIDTPAATTNALPRPAAPIISKPQAAHVSTATKTPWVKLVLALLGLALLGAILIAFGRGFSLQDEALS